MLVHVSLIINTADCTVWHFLFAFLILNLIDLVNINLIDLVNIILIDLININLKLSVQVMQVFSKQELSICHN